MARRTVSSESLPSEPYWYKSGVIYEVHVRAFYDSNGDGIGDFQGLTQKLDYLKDLGVTAVWLLPFYPSPLKDDGYDIADYYGVHPIYGALADFKHFLREAHRRGLRVITELVLNHTSDQHPWFQRARRSPPGSRWRNFYVWSDTADRYKEARIIFKDVEHSNWAWDPVARAYYWHRFFSHQPDLNYDNPEVHREIIKVVDFWLDLGVDGLRLDAVPYLYEREGTSCENLPETHAFLKKLRAHVDEKYQGRMLLAEANQWPEDAAAYFGEGRGDECHMAFHFPLMPRLFMALRMEDRTPIVDILEQTPPIPETAQWALFLRNHDELTLEMVTDEERDYMYRAYAHVNQARLNLGIRRRLAPLLGNDRKRIELLNALLLSLPGTPVLYYGDEIGMGDNIFLGDRNGVRTPMQWSSDKNAGFSRANPQSLYLPVIYDPEYHYEVVNVEAQLRNPHSLLWWMRRLLALRKRWRALGEGKCEFLHPENRKILSYLLRYENETLLVVANLSRFVQAVELDLAAFRGYVPVELFGRTEFPVIRDKPYFLTLSPHAFFWFSLEPKSAVLTWLAGPEAPAAGAVRPALAVPDRWTRVVEDTYRARFEAALQQWLPHRRWFGGKARPVTGLHLREWVEMPLEHGSALLCFVQVDYAQGESDLYVVPLTFAQNEVAQKLLRDNPAAVLCDLQLTRTSDQGVIHDALVDRAFCRKLAEWIGSRSRIRAAGGELIATRTPLFRRLLEGAAVPEPQPARAEQSNSSVLYGDKFILKLFRRGDVGVNPDLEITHFLTAREFPYAQQLAGALEFVRQDNQRITLATLNRFIPGARDAWSHTLDALGRYFDRVATFLHEGRVPPAEPVPPPRWIRLAVSEEVGQTVGTYLELARLLGERTAALHLVLASETEDPAFAPESFTPHYLRGLFQALRNLARQNLGLLRHRLASLPAAVQPLAEQVLAREPAIIGLYRRLYEKGVQARRIRCHGDYHLGQVLYTGKDFVIIDFEGEPALALSERRIKRSPLRDVAGMLRSFDYAAWAGLEEHIQRGGLQPEQRPRYQPWVKFWVQTVSAVYLQAYLDQIQPAQLLPPSEEDLALMLEAYLLNKAVYELAYELNNRPDWIRIPLQGILQLLPEEARP
ncbi:maltose alpha-D-glucosyltransferase [Limisphaera sp. 4302-co]|uniref:maltose alpha-D-glucosyltransferase n=1 Tax=Limisphaera sp. 4302-co TaxID=3400417 RepID=UPI003C2483CD